MKNKKQSWFRLWNGLLAAVVAFCVAYSGVGCVMSAFSLEKTVILWQLIIWCAGLSILGAVCFSVRRGWIVLLCLLALGLGCFLWKGTLLREIVGDQQSMETICPVTGMQVNPGVTKGLAALGGMAALAVCLTVCVGKSALPALIFGFLPLAVCCPIMDTVPDKGYLFLLLGSLLLIVLSQSVRRFDQAQGLRLTAMLLVPVALYTALLSSRLPQTEYEKQSAGLISTVSEWVSRLFEGGTRPGNIPEELLSAGSVDLTRVGPEERQMTPLMDVLCKPRQALYLRGQAFDVYTGTGWYVSEESGEADLFWTFSEESIDTVRVATRGSRTDRFLPYYIKEFLDIRNGQLANSESEHSFLYTIYGQGVLTADPDGSALVEQCLKLPEDTKERARKILQGIRLRDTQRSIANAVAEYVCGSAQYSLDTAVMPLWENDFALWFLEESDTGYCTHFASAATVLLRAAGIPARYVTGYRITVTSENKQTVRASDAHAWVEYLDEKSGWTVLDPTPAEPKEIPTEAQTELLVPPETQPHETEPEAQTPTAGDAPENPDVTASAPTQAPATQPQQRNALPGYVWGILSAVVALIGQYLLRRFLRLRSFFRGTPNRQALNHWRQVQRMAWLLRLDLPKRLQFLAEKAAFSQHMLTAQELGEFDLWLKQAEQAIRDKPLLWNLLIRLIWAI